MRPEILVVSRDDDGRAVLVKALTEAGYHTRDAASFEEGKRLLLQKTPDFVIADERLGAYNGLHLIIRGRINQPQMGGIVTSSAKDPALEAEARRLNVQCVVKPADPSDLLRPISAQLAA
jgi:DNA-binding response OmpR family regulator